MNKSQQEMMKHVRHSALSEDERRKQHELEQARHARLEHMKQQNNERAIHEAFEREGEILRQEREEKSHPKEIKLFNLTWEHTNQDVQKARDNKVYIGETINLLVSQENADSRNITLQIHDLKLNRQLEPELLADRVTVKATQKDLSVAWHAQDPRSKKEADREMDLQVMAIEPRSSVSTEMVPIPLFNKPVLEFLEIEDCHFRHDSLVFIPDEVKESANEEGNKTDGINMLRSVLLYAFRFNKLLFIAGHTDRSGDEQYNVELSRDRAKVVYYLLTGDSEENGKLWAELTNTKMKPEDQQHLMKWVSKVRGVPECDPGEIDGIIGNNTKSAIEAFQRYCNDNLNPSEKLNTDGIIGPKTLAQVFVVIQQQLANEMIEEEDALNNRTSLSWAFDQPYAGFGEMHPITDKERSQTDRRVQILFFNEDEIPQEKVNGNDWLKDEVCEEPENPIYREDSVFEQRPLDPEVGYGLEIVEWEHLESNKPQGICNAGDTIRIFARKVDPNCEVGDVSFHIYKSNEESDENLVEGMGSLPATQDGECYYADIIIDDTLAQLPGNPSYRASHSIEPRRKTNAEEISIVGTIELIFNLDPDNRLYSKYYEDSVLTLTSESEDIEYREEKTLKEDAITIERIVEINGVSNSQNVKTLLFTNIDRSGRYKLEIQKNENAPKVELTTQEYNEFNSPAQSEQNGAE